MHTHLTQKQRIELSLLSRLGYSQRATANELGVSPSTICRELSRNGQPGRGYHVTHARMQTIARRVTANQGLRKLADASSALIAYIVEALTTKQWSPDQIAQTLKQSGCSVRVCAQTIYDWVYTQRTDLIQYLRSKKQKYRRTRANTLRKQQRAALFATRRIDKRPASVAGRKFYGHWEGDTMVSSQTVLGRIGTLVERKSGYLVAFLLPNGNSDGFARSAAAALITHKVPTRYLKTMTLDNGLEMQSYELLELLTPLQVFFAYPYHSWERGTNENTNGLLRQYFAKGSDLGLVTQEQLDLAVKLLNTRPRKRLRYKTPEQVFLAKW
jgi:IS30 family transposase